MGRYRDTLILLRPPGTYHTDLEINWKRSHPYCQFSGKRQVLRQETEVKELAWGWALT